MGTPWTRRFLKTAVFFSMFFAVYFITGKLGLRMAVLNASATAVWAPTGIAIAASSWNLPSHASTISFARNAAKNSRSG